MGGLDILSCSPKQCPPTAHELRVRLPCCSAREPHPQPCPGTQFWSSKPSSLPSVIFPASTVRPCPKSQLSSKEQVWCDRIFPQAMGLVSHPDSSLCGEARGQPGTCAGPLSQASPRGSAARAFVTPLPPGEGRARPHALRGRPARRSAVMPSVETAGKGCLATCVLGFYLQRKECFRRERDGSGASLPSGKK